MSEESAPGAKAPEAEGGAGQTPALAVITAFGGIRPMAKALGVAVSTVQGWKERGAIPANRHEAILNAARAQKVELDEAQLRSSDHPSATDRSWSIHSGCLRRYWRRPRHLLGVVSHQSRRWRGDERLS